MQLMPGGGVPDALLGGGVAVAEGEAGGVVVNQAEGQGRLVLAQSGRLQRREECLRQGEGVRADGLAGLQQGDARVVFEDGLLTIQGERRFAHDSADEKVHRAERSYGAFRRSITLPSHVEADKIEAATQDGVLQVLVPKAPEVQAKRIQVRAGQGRTVLTSGATASNGS
jgi:Hsp20/alpha crystallin family